MRLVIEVDDARDGIAGWIYPSLSDAVRFDTWYELVAAIAPLLDGPGEAGGTGDR